MQKRLSTILTFFTFFCLALMMLAVACADEPRDEATLKWEFWQPTMSPRSDVECWRSGHSVVCLPMKEVRHECDSEFSRG